MSTGRLEAFSDGVIAIIITLMVFKIEAPSSLGPSGIRDVLPAVLTFAMTTSSVNGTDKGKGLGKWKNEMEYTANALRK